MIFLNPNARSNQNIPNLGLAYAATHHQVPVIDLNTMPEPADRYLRHPTDVLGISLQSRSWGEGQRIIEKYRAAYPEAKIRSVTGFVDVQCCYPYLRLPESIDFSAPFSDQYPFPDYALFDSFPLFLKNWRKGLWSYAIMTSQGCPYGCTFCASRNRKWRARSAGNAAAELRQAREKWGIRQFSILDDCFNVDKPRLLEFCSLVRPLDLTWGCANGLRADRFDAEESAALRAAGCRELSFGAESADPVVLKNIKKGETLEQIAAALDAAKKDYDPLHINLFFIIGLPGSSYDSDLASLRWAQERGVHAHFSYHVPAQETLRHDSLFYGEEASPLSDAYPKERQREVYALAQQLWNRPVRPGPWARLKRFLRA